MQHIFLSKTGKLGIIILLFYDKYPMIAPIHHFRYMLGWNSIYREPETSAMRFLSRDFVMLEASLLTAVGPKLFFSYIS